MTVNESDITTNCGSVPGVANCQVTGSFENASVYKYTFTYDIDLRNTGFYIPPSKSDVSPSIKITTTSGVTSANVFVIKTINDNNRISLIDESENKIHSINISGAKVFTFGNKQLYITDDGMFNACESVFEEIK